MWARSTWAEKYNFTIRPNLDRIQIRLMLVVAFLVTASLRSACAQVSSVQKFQIHVTEPRMVKKLEYTVGSDWVTC